MEANWGVDFLVRGQILIGGIGNCYIVQFLLVLLINFFHVKIEIIF